MKYRGEYTRFNRHGGRASDTYGNTRLVQTGPDRNATPVAGWLLVGLVVLYFAWQFVR